jgi:small subunit ribosomal protein S16
MAVVIRLTQMGKKGERKYRVAVKEKRSKRDGGAIEYLGWYEKTATGEKKKIDQDRFTYWLSKGAKASPTVAKIMEQA